MRTAPMVGTCGPIVAKPWANGIGEQMEKRSQKSDNPQMSVLHPTYLHQVVKVSYLGWNAFYFVSLQSQDLELTQITQLHGQRRQHIVIQT